MAAIIQILGAVLVHNALVDLVLIRRGEVACVEVIVRGGRLATSLGRPIKCTITATP